MLTYAKNRCKNSNFFEYLDHSIEKKIIFATRNNVNWVNLLPKGNF